MTKKTQLYIIIYLSFTFVNAQHVNTKRQDSLSNKNYEYLSKAVSTTEKDSLKCKIYLKAWSSKSKSNNDFRQLIDVYKIMLYKADKKFWVQYADSMLIAAKKTYDNELIGSSYLTKATVYYGRNEQIKALDNFLFADKYISQTDNEYLIFKVKYGIAQTKYYLGFYEEAISLFRECIDYFKEENDRAYLNSLHSLGLCYNHIGNYEWCTITNQMGIDEGRKLENLEMEPYFIHSEGVNLCGKHKYKEAIKELNKALPNIIKVKDFANETVAYFYIGKSYWEMKQEIKAIAYFKKVDKTFEKEGYIRPDLREGYERLIDYYKNQNDTKSQLFYINQLLKVDKVLGQNYKYLLQKIVKEYDTKELLKSKQDIEKTMTFRTSVGFSIIGVLIIVIVVLINRHFKNKRLFEEIMKRDTSKPATSENNNSQKGIEEIIVTNSDSINSTENSDKQNTQEISPDIEIGIVKKLEKFEQNKKYLEKDMTLTKMASLLNTNTKYVTKIIAKHRGKGTIEYITDLKIDYIIHILKTESKYRNYTNKALGEEAGFGSTQNFTKSFKERNGISPTYFIYKLKKSINTGNYQ